MEWIFEPRKKNNKKTFSPYLVVRNRVRKHVFGKKELPPKKREKDFGEMLNTEYNNDRLYSIFNGGYKTPHRLVREEKKNKACYYCGKILTNPKALRNGFCGGCGCDACKKYDEDLKIYYFEKEDSYLCEQCK
jgi:hypothetical protein